MGEKEYKCCQCGTGCTSKYHLAQHILGTHFKELLQGYDEDIKDYIKGFILNRLSDNKEIITDYEDTCMINNCNQCENFYIDEFIDKKKPICREERQFSLYLYNKLKNNNREVMEKIGLKDSTILYVFYEATLMRDYWFANKEKFNQELIRYITDKFDKNFKIDENEIRHARAWKVDSPYARWMMNAKPDIAIITSKDNKLLLNLIECKYYSNEDTYNDAEKKIQCTQTEIQKYIIDFLCNYLRVKLKEEKEKEIEAGDIIKVQFISKNCTKNPYEGYKQIDICMLID